MLCSVRNLGDNVKDYFLISNKNIYKSEKGFSQYTGSVLGVNNQLQKLHKSDNVKDFCLLKCLFWEVECCTKYLCKFVGGVKIVNICVIICINNFLFYHGGLSLNDTS